MVLNAIASPRVQLARWFMLATALWILAGASFKLLWGTPADLPPVLFELGLSKVAVYRLAIAAELFIVSAALLKPRLGWWLCAAALVVFDLILASQLAAGAESCGCFGSKISIPPAAMLAIDSALLVGLLAGRPWRVSWRPDVALLPGAVAALGLASLPYLLDRSVQLPQTTQAPSAKGGPANPTVGVSPDAAPGAAESQASPIDEPSPRPNAPELTPSGLRGYLDLDLGSWLGKRIEETPLANLMDVYAMDQDCTWILWRWTCEHCAEHFEQLASTYDGSEPLVLVRLREPADSDANRVVHVLPQGPLVLQAELPDTVDYLATTPVVLRLEQGVIVELDEG